MPLIPTLRTSPAGRSDAGNAEAWRLLGESSLLSQQPRKAMPAFERAVELRSAAQPGALPAPGGGVALQPDLQLLTGLTDAYIANGDYAKVRASVRVGACACGCAWVGTCACAGGIVDSAVSLKPTPPCPAPQAIESLKSVRERLRAAQAASASASPAAAALPGAPGFAQPEALPAPTLAASSSEPSSSSPSEPSAAPSAASSSSSAQPRASPAPALAGAVSGPPPLRALDPVGLELLQAKVFTAWRGHEQVRTSGSGCLGLDWVGIGSFGMGWTALP
jgi:hypothetical protein